MEISSYFKKRKIAENIGHTVNVSGEQKLVFKLMLMLLHVNKAMFNTL